MELTITANPFSEADNVGIESLTGRTKLLQHLDHGTGVRVILEQPEVIHRYRRVTFLVREYLRLQVEPVLGKEEVTLQLGTGQRQVIDVLALKLAGQE